MLLLTVKCNLDNNQRSTIKGQLIFSLQKKTAKIHKEC